MTDHDEPRSPTAEQQVEALAFVLRCVRRSYDVEPELSNLLHLVEQVVGAVERNDRATALVAGTRLLSEAELVKLWNLLTRPADTSRPEDIAERLRERLPNPVVEDGVGIMRPDLTFSVESGLWEVEWCPLDPKRNVVLRRPSLADALQAVLAHDDAALSDHGSENR